jgi:hypothetical protein
MSANITTPITSEQAARSHALDLCAAHSRDLTVIFRDACTSDQCRPIKQKDRHALQQRVREKLRLIEARLEEACK